MILEPKDITKDINSASFILIKSIETNLEDEVRSILPKSISMATRDLTYRDLKGSSVNPGRLGNPIVYTGYDVSGGGSAAVKIVVKTNGDIYIRYMDGSDELAGFVTLERIFAAAVADAMVAVFSGIVKATKKNITDMVTRFAKRAKVKLLMDIKKHRIEYTRIILRDKRLLDNLFSDILNDDPRGVFKDFRSIGDKFLIGPFTVEKSNIPDFYAYPFTNSVEFAGEYRKLGKLNHIEFEDVLVEFTWNQ